MWTLVIITLLTAQAGTGGANGRAGVATTTTVLDFKDQQTCNTAAHALEVKSDTFPGTVTEVGGIYRIIAECFARQ
ncbi:MAG: hypothetical protein JO283_14180 [Bradyrhizobium sp.]|nr:hypothetical protein [Bradyrhizobium sp.]